MIKDIPPKKSSINNEYNNKLKSAHQHLNDYFSSIKTNSINYLQAQISQINSAYQTGYNTNLNLLLLLEKLFDHYSTTYNLSLYEFKEEISNTECVIKYLKDYHIITTEEDCINIEENLQDIRAIKENNSIFLLHLLRDGRLISCTEKVLRVYDNKNFYHCSVCICEDSCCYSICELSDGSIVTGMYERIKIWKIYKDSYQCLFELYEEENEKIAKVCELSEDRIVSLSQKIIIVWDIKEKKAIKKIKGETNKNFYSMLYIKEKNVILVTTEKELKKYNMSTYQLICQINQIPNKIYNLLQIDDNSVLMGGYSQLCIANFDTGTYSVAINANISSFIKLRDNTTILCGCDGYFLILDLKNKTYIHKKAKYENSILSMVIIDESTFASASGDTILFWKY